MRSDLIKSGPDRAPARAMLRATGLDDEAIARPLVAVVHTWSNVSPCNLNLRELAVEAAAGIRAAGAGGGHSAYLGVRGEVAFPHACKSHTASIRLYGRGWSLSSHCACAIGFDRRRESSSGGT